jgi:hypothetical protein
MVPPNGIDAWFFGAPFDGAALVAAAAMLT